MLAEFKPYSIKLKNVQKIVEQPMIMGILNTTSDSFFDGGKYHTIETALNRCDKLMTEGADIIDIGGQSTRPGAEMTTVEEEIQKTIPVIEAIVKRFPEAIISIDTFRSKVARLAVEAGACIVNDVSAGDDDEQMIPFVASLQVPFIAMHKKGQPKTMQNNPHYDNVVMEVDNYFKHKIQQLETSGIKDIIIDLGFGFGKTLENNYKLMQHLGDFHHFSRPILVGISRKTMIWKLLETNPDGALNGTTVLNTIALQKGAQLLRVHDVKEAVEVRKILGML